MQVDAKNTENNNDDFQFDLRSNELIANNNSRQDITLNGCETRLEDQRH